MVLKTATSLVFRNRIGHLLDMHEPSSHLMDGACALILCYQMVFSCHIWILECTCCRSSYLATKTVDLITHSSPISGEVLLCWRLYVRMSGYARSVGDVEPGDPVIQMSASGRKVGRNLIAFELMLVRPTIDEADSISSFALLNSSSLQSCGLSRLGLFYLSFYRSTDWRNCRKLTLNWPKVLCNWYFILFRCDLSSWPKITFKLVSMWN